MKCKHSQIYMKKLNLCGSLTVARKKFCLRKVLLHELMVTRGKGRGRIVREFGIEMLLLYFSC